MGRVHITGASGSGATSLGIALAGELGHRHFDADDYYWVPTQPLYTVKRPMPQRIERLEEDLSRHQSWVLSGSLCGWGDRLISQFDLVVFLTLSKGVRLERLRQRETQRFGSTAIEPGGARAIQYDEFMSWAARYDEGGLDVRSRALHEQWLQRLPCPVVRLNSELSVHDLLKSVYRSA